MLKLAMSMNLEELRAYFEPPITEDEFGHAAGLPVVFLRILPGRLGECCSDQVRELLARLDAALDWHAAEVRTNQQLTSPSPAFKQS